jgi:hypothetical protein
VSADCSQALNNVFKGRVPLISIGLRCCCFNISDEDVQAVALKNNAGECSSRQLHNRIVGHDRQTSVPPYVCNGRKADIEECTTSKKKGPAL